MEKIVLDGVTYAVSADSFRAELKSEKTNENITILHFSLHAGAPTTPHKAEISFLTAVPDVFSSFTPQMDEFPSVRPSWHPISAPSRSASGAPVIALVAADGKNRLTVSLSEAAEATCVSAGVTEEEGLFRIKIQLFTELTCPITDYRVDIRLDRRQLTFSETLDSVREWWDILYPPCRIPAVAKEPLYSSWYNFHQNLHTAELVRECTLAAELGMKTVILDDGWQTDDNSRGYAYCGDWKPAATKIGDMAALSDALHALGMKVMLWYSVPYVGIFSENYPRFKGKYLNENDGANGAKAFVLDPRFRECRQFLVEIYRTAVKEWHLDGLKLDFIDSFKLTDGSSQSYDQMDTVSLEEAVEMLLDEITSVLKAENPDFLIEFRQNYIGPVMRRHGNMLRVSDCPAGALYNHVRGVGLRLTSGKTAVHSDMLMWHETESVESAALQIINSLFLVPQISVRLCELPAEHLAMLRFYLAFWRENRKVILDGKLSVKGQGNNYTAVSASLDGTEITVLYGRNDIFLTALHGAVVNGTGEMFFFFESEKDYIYEIKTCTGEAAGDGILSCGLAKLTMPPGGVLFYRAAD